MTDLPDPLRNYHERTPKGAGNSCSICSARLANDGDSLELLASEQNHRVYLVKLNPDAAP